MPWTIYAFILQWLDVRDRTNRYYSCRINVSKGPIVVCFDVLKIGCILEGIVIPIQLFQPSMNIRIPSPDGPDVTLEVPHVHGVESNYGDE